MPSYGDQDLCPRTHFAPVTGGIRLESDFLQPIIARQSLSTLQPLIGQYVTLSPALSRNRGTPWVNLDHVK